MKKYIVLPLVAVLFLFGCEEVIEVDLNEADPQLVVEANLSVQEGELNVLLTRTSSYFDQSPPVPVTDAAVTLRVEGSPFNVPHSADGNYRLPVNVSHGQTLELEVLDAGSEPVTARLEVPRYVPMDSIGATYLEPSSFFDGGSVLTLFFQDPPNEESFYRIRIILDGEILDGPEDLIVERDLFADGEYINYTAFGYFFDGGETVDVIVESIPPAAYEYYTTLSDIVVFQGGGSTAAPANPTTNLSNKALGLFNVYQSDTVSIVVPTP